MNISQILSQKDVTFSFEVFPPKKHDALTAVTTTVVDLCTLKPDFISVTCGAGGTRVENSDTVTIATAIEKAQVPSLAHVTCVGLRTEDAQNTIHSLKEKNVKNVLVLRGDKPQDGNDYATDFPYASDLVPLFKDAGFCCGGACYPEGHPESANKDVDLDNLKRKVDAGLDFLTTQMFFDNDMLYSFLYRMQSKGIHIPVIAGIMPVTNAAQIKRMISLSNAYMPRHLLSIIDSFSDSPQAMMQAGIAYATEQIIDLIINGVRGIHLYTMNKPEIARSILHNVEHILAAKNAQ